MTPSQGPKPGQRAKASPTGNGRTAAAESMLHVKWASHRQAAYHSFASVHRIRSIVQGQQQAVRSTRRVIEQIDSAGARSDGDDD